MRAAAALSTDFQNSQSSSTSEMALIDGHKFEHVEIRALRKSCEAVIDKLSKKNSGWLFFAYVRPDYTGVEVCAKKNNSTDIEKLVVFDRGNRSFWDGRLSQSPEKTDAMSRIWSFFASNNEEAAVSGVLSEQAERFIESKVLGFSGPVAATGHSPRKGDVIYPSGTPAIQHGVDPEIQEAAAVAQLA